jgi:thiol-disulfide isomerase/thioredoxin
MAKSKQKAPSAAQRRDKQRQQRQQRLAGSQNNRTQVAQARSKGPAQRQSNRRQWLWTGGIVALIAVIIVAFIVISRLQSPGSASGPTLASSQVFNAVTKVDSNVLAAVGKGGVTNPLKAVNGSPPILKGPTGKPEFLYMGAEYCPYCAAERWAVVVALSRFGTFSKLYQTTSSSTDVYPSTPTFTFYSALYKGPVYTSSYIDFVPVETQGNVQDSSGNYPTLQTPTAAQQNLLSTYDAAPYTSQAGSIPFIDFGNRYVLIGASYNAQDLANLQWQDIANDLADSNSAVSKDILGTANYLTAGICMLTQQQPGSVCSTPVIQSIEQSLGKAVSPGGPHIAVSGHLEAVMRRQD